MNRDYQFQIVMVDLKQFSQIYLVPISDLHEGCIDADHEVSDGYIRWVAEHENAFTILNGDLVNCSTKDSLPELFEDLITPDEAYRRLLKRLLPIKDKVLMITRGNHEERVFRQVGIDLMARLAYDLGNIPYRPDGGMIAIRLGLYGHTSVFTGWATHGWGNARTIGAKVKKVEDLANAVDCDFIIISHDHTQNVHRLNVLCPPSDTLSWGRPNYMAVKRRILINTGGFIKYGGYIRRKGNSPQDLGTPRLRLEFKKEHGRYHKDLHASI